MKKINKLMFVIPLALLIFGCSKKSDKTTTKEDTEPTTTIKTTTKETTNTTRRTTTVATTTEDVFDILVTKTINEAATIRGAGIFNLNSSTTIRVELNYGYDYLGLYDGENKLTEELEYEISSINKNMLITAKFSPKNFNVTVNKDIEEAATTTGDGLVPYNTSTTIDFTLDNEYLFVGLYDDKGNLVSEEPQYKVDTVTTDLTFNAKFKQKTYDVVVEQSLKHAAEVTGEGSFIKGSNTTLEIKANDGFHYLGLYDGENKLTDETTYDVTNITSPVTLTAMFSADSFTVKTDTENEDLGTVTLIDGTYDCGTEIKLEATVAEGYEVEGWYVNDAKYGEGNTITFIVPAYNSEVVAKFKIKYYKITITDNIEGIGSYYVGDNLYSIDNDYSYDFGEYVWIDIYDVKGYVFDYMLINGERHSDSYEELLMNVDYEIEVFYELDDMYFYMMYDRSKLTINNGIILDILPDDYDTDVIDSGDYKGYSYLSGYYKYKTVINIKLNVRTNYYLDSFKNLYELESIGSIENDIITLTIEDDYFGLLITVLGKICHMTAEAQDPLSGTVTGSGDYHYGDYAKIVAKANKGYKFVKWVDGEGNEFGKVYWIVHDYVDESPEVPLFGDATFKAVFEPDEFYFSITLVAYNATKEAYSCILTYLTEYDIYAPEVSGYAFAGWLENEDIDSLFSTDEVLHYTMIDEDSTIYAYYTPKTFTITFNPDGGTGGDTTLDLVYGDEFETQVPTKENFTFMGYHYYHEEEIINFDYTGSMQIGHYLTHYKYYDVYYVEHSLLPSKYVLINGEAATDYTTLVYEGDIVTIVEYTTPDMTVKADGKSDGGLGYGHNCEFRAVWGALVTIKYNNGKADSSKAYYLDDVLSTPETPTKEGNKFLGWFVDDEEYDFSTRLTHNIVIEAKWEELIYSVTLTQSDSRYGEIVNPITSAKYGDTITLTFNTFDNYTFEYWRNLDTNEKFTDSTITFTMPAQNIRFKAIVSAYVLYVLIDDESMGTVREDSFIARPGSEVEIEAIPGDGYGFAYWKMDGEIVSYEAKTKVIMPKNAMAIVRAFFGRLVTDKYERLGDKVWFGYYPQTCLNTGLQDDEYLTLINELKEMAGPLPTLDTIDNYESTKEDTDWINYDYYIYPGGVWNKRETIVNPDYSTSTKTTYLKAPHMWYIDIDYDNDGKYDYRGVLIYSYRVDEIKQNEPSSGTSNSHQDDNHYSTNASYRTYWFKYELVEWDILENNDGTVKMIANLAIDSQNFSLSSNNYDSSYIRDFLNDDFYNTAFNDLEKSIMSTMTIGSNSDYVTLLTQEEATSYFENNADRTTQPTDYAMSQNCYVYSSPSIYNPTNDGNCYWLTRSAYTTSGNIYYVSYNGSITYGKTNMTYYGIRPVITITL